MSCEQWRTRDWWGVKLSGQRCSVDAHVGHTLAVSRKITIATIQWGQSNAATAVSSPSKCYGLVFTLGQISPPPATGQPQHRRPHLNKYTKPSVPKRIHLEQDFGPFHSAVFAQRSCVTAVYRPYDWLRHHATGSSVAIVRIMAYLQLYRQVGLAACFGKPGMP